MSRLAFLIYQALRLSPFEPRFPGRRRVRAGSKRFQQERYDGLSHPDNSKVRGMQNLFCYLRQMSSLSLPLFGGSLEFRAQPFRLSFQVSCGICFTRKRNPRVLGAAVLGPPCWEPPCWEIVSLMPLASLPVNPL